MATTPTTRREPGHSRLDRFGHPKVGRPGGLRWWQRWLSVVLGVVLAVSIGVDPRLAVAAPVSGLPDVQVWEPVDAHEVTPVGDGAAGSPEQMSVTDPVFPAGSGEVAALAEARAVDQWREVGETGIEVRSGAAVKVEVADKAVTKAAGITGAIFRVELPDGLSATDVRLDYARFDSAAGGGYGSRLQLVSLPACVLDTPKDPACRTTSRVSGSVNDPAGKTVTAQVVDPAGVPVVTDATLTWAGDGGEARQTPAPTVVSPTAGSSTSAASQEPTASPQPGNSQAASATPEVSGASPSVSASVDTSVDTVNPQQRSGAGAVMVLAAVAGESGSNGSFEATSLAATGSWSVGGSTGGFQWSYPLAVPSAGNGGGLAPTIEFGYSSSRVDGRVASSNNQPGWIGQGFDYDPGFVERSYKPCRDTGVEEVEDSHELCWAGEILTLGRAGSSDRLVADDQVDGLYKPAHDDGTRVERLTGADNGALDGEYWKVTSPDGVVYYYGLGVVPGGDHTEFTVPVVGAEDGDPCYNSDGVTQSRCDQAWRWSLDYVEDPHRNAMVFYYEPEHNYYTPEVDESVEYIRGGLLAWIDYGMRNTGNALSEPTNRIGFTLDERCIPDDDFDCDPDAFDEDNAEYWPDTPRDLDCDADSCNLLSPTFWSRKRLTAVTAYDGYDPVDRWELEQSYPGLGDSALWLDSVTHVGIDPADGSEEALPPVEFGGVLLANRVTGLNSLPSMYMWRVNKITDELGGNVAVTYSAPDCSADDLPDENDLENNTSRCFPTIWVLPYQEDPTLDFFHTYVVESVRVGDPQHLSPDQLSTYTYLGAPAWHYDDSELKPEDQRSYGQFRGYRTVEVRTGDPNWTSNGTADQVTLTRTHYLRGMDGDQLPDDDTRDVVVAAGAREIRDAAPLAGRPYLIESFDGDGGDLLSTQVIVSEVLDTTARQARDGLPDLTATITASTWQSTTTQVASGDPQQVTSTTWHDDRGRPIAQQDTATGLPDVCATTQYADHADGVRYRTSQVTKYEAACAADGGAPDVAVIAATRTYYDGKALGVLTGTGNPTTSQTAIEATGSGLRWASTTQQWDAVGRVTKTVAKPGGGQPDRTTTTSFTTSGGRITKMVQKNALGHTTTTVVDPRGLPVSVTDPAGATTTAERDPLGRVTKVWSPGFATTGTPSVEYEYRIDPDALDAVITRTQTTNGTALRTLTSVSLSDGFGQVIQTQATSTNGGGRVISDSVYDSHGQVVRTNNAWYTLGAPGTSLMVAADSAIDSRTVIGYDGAGRQTEKIDFQGLTEKRRTQSVYGGDRVTVLPPDGGVPTTTITDARGNTASLLEYRETPTIDGNVVTGGDPITTNYTYDTAGQLTGMTDATGAVWTRNYDLAGRLVAASDPDSGISTTGYNDLGEPISSTDARGVTVTTGYDQAGRPLSMDAGSQRLAAWTYDTVRAGETYEAISYVDGDTANPYVQRVDAYDDAGRATSATTIIPATQTGLAGSYTTTTSFTASGQIRAISYPALGDLSAQTLTYTYNDQGAPVSLTGGGTTWVKSASWSPHAALSQVVFNSAANIAETFYRDPETLRITEQRMSNTGAYSNVDVTKYFYDDAGKITRTESDRGYKVSNAYRATCYQYNGLAQLATVWTENRPGDQQQQCGIAPSATDSSMVAGAYPIWQEYAWDAVGNRTSFTTHHTAVQTATQTTTFAYSPDTAPIHALDDTTIDGTPDTHYSYDPAGNLTSRTTGGITETWMWNPSGKAASIASGDQVTSYVYAADDTQLIRTDPDGSATLFLPDGTELAATSDGVKAGTRYLEFGGQGLIQQTKAGKWVLYADQTGTATVAHNMATLTTYVRRTQDPFGNQLSGTLGGVWPNQRGYLNKPHSTFTNITDIGARKYDPVTGRFTSVDPQLDPAAPATHNGYAYTAADPINQVDPTGLGVWDTINNIGNAIKGVASKAVSAVKNFFTAPPANTGPSSSSAAPYQPATSGNTPASAPAVSAGEAALTAMIVGAAAGTGAGALAFPIVGPVGAAAVSGAVSGAVTYVVNQILTGQDVNIEDLLLTTIIGALLGAGLGKVANAPVVRQFIKAKVARIASILGKRSLSDVPASAPKPPNTTTPTPATPTQNGATAATKSVPNEGTYVVRNGAGEVYIGQSGNITNRLGQHVATGKFTQAEVDAAQRFEVLGGKTSREVAEQLKLDSFGGRDAPGILNKVNPIGDRRLNLMPEDYVRS